MSPPTEEERLSSLAALAGEDLPAQASLVDPLDRALVRIKLIVIAKGRGASWAQVAPFVDATSGPQAKAAFKRLAKTTQAAVIRRDMEAGRRAG